METISGMSIGGGSKEDFFLCLFEYYPAEDRFFLTNLRQVGDDEKLDRDETIMSWVEEHGLLNLIVDFPLTKPTCDTCSLKCPGTSLCPHPVVKKVRSEMEELLSKDAPMTKSIYTKSFKRKLKKGFLPYWNRPLDFFIWKNYHDSLLEYFKISFDSFGSVSLILLNRFRYLLRHFPKELKLYESNVNLVLLELFKAKIITKKHLQDLQDMTMAPIARVEIVKEIEKKCKIFIYANDLEILAKKSRAFDSFLLALAGKNMLQNKIITVPDFGEDEKPHFVIPIF